MDDKKLIKINIQSALLIFAIILIIIMSVCIGILYKQNIEYKNKDDVVNAVKEEMIEQNITRENITELNTNVANNADRNTTTSSENKNITVINSDKSDKKGTKLLQFDTEFYDLKDVALEYRTLGNIKNYKDFEYDLDGDEQKDKITIIHKNEKYEIKLNGKTFGDNNIETIDSVYIVDFNKNDKKIEVVFQGNGPSDDPYYKIYSKDGTNMKEIKEIEGFDLKTDQRGNVVVEKYFSTLTPKFYPSSYIVNNGIVNEKYNSTSVLENTWFRSENLFFTSNLNNIKKWNNRNSEEDIEKSLKKYEILKGNYKFKIIKIINNQQIYVKLDNGKEGYIVYIQLAG